MKGWLDKINQRKLFPGATLFSAGWLSANRTEGMPKFRNLGEEETLAQSLMNKHFVWIDQ